jgi:hypothetical protein
MATVTPLVESSRVAYRQQLALERRVFQNRLQAVTFDDQRVAAIYEAQSSSSSATRSARSRQVENIVADWHAVTLDCGWIIVHYFSFADGKCVESVIVDQFDH